MTCAQVMPNRFALGSHTKTADKVCHRWSNHTSDSSGKAPHGKDVPISLTAFPIKPGGTEDRSDPFGGIRALASMAKSSSIRVTIAVATHLWKKQYAGLEGERIA